MAKKVCYFCENNLKPDYKKPKEISRFMQEGKLKSASKTGLCAKHQRMLGKARANAHHLGFI